MFLVYLSKTVLQTGVIFPHVVSLNHPQKRSVNCWKFDVIVIVVLAFLL